MVPQQLSAALDGCSWVSGVRVALLLGSSVISPKEVYVLHFPAIAAQLDRHPRCLHHQRGAVQLFRWDRVAGDADRLVFTDLQTVASLSYAWHDMADSAMTDLLVSGTLGH